MNVLLFFSCQKTPHDPSQPTRSLGSFAPPRLDRLLFPRRSRNRKSMSVLCRTRGDEPHNRLFVKGAPEMLVKRCSKVLDCTSYLVYNFHQVWLMYL